MSELINDNIKNYQPKSYANVSTYPAILDCSLGVHYEQIPSHMLNLLKTIDEKTIKQYPNDLSLIEKIINIYKPYVELSKEQVSIGDGSYNLLTNINLLYLLGGKTLFSYVPNFSAYTDHAYLIGAKHKYYSLKESNNFKFIEDDFLTEMKYSNASLIFVENPNNPTGQILPIKTIEKIIALANSLNMAVLIDEAYGEYMPVENSAISLVNKYDNLFVSKSFSKGYAMAGIRVGYAVGSLDASKYLQKFIIPFNGNSIGRILAENIISNKYTEHIIENTKEKKLKLLNALDSMENLKVSYTSSSTPIMLIYTNLDLNLWEYLRKVGLNTVSGLSYESLDKNSVRLMIRDEVDLIVKLLKEADKIIGEVSEA